ncbi:hypothetical protein CRM22_009778 [Opisthorchis felineus]|uniref:Ras-GAP domain-containing protein n=1 Tax=Opisthorchis felineus TaxID=147828 RepID=A0A4S2L6X0_OPIFE|nr:hypothetical protein CRM22_009778 [Opisthorchis felineus]
MATASVPFLRVVDCRSDNNNSSIDSVLSKCGDLSGRAAVPHSATSPYMMRVDPSDNKTTFVQRSASLARQRFGPETKSTDTRKEGSRRQRRSHFVTGSIPLTGSEVQPNFGPLTQTIYREKGTSMKPSGGRKFLSFFQRGFHAKRPKSATKMEQRKSSNEFLGSTDSLVDQSTCVLRDSNPAEALKVLHQQIHLPAELLNSFAIVPSVDSRRSTLTLTQSPMSVTSIQPVDSSMCDLPGRFCFQVVTNRGESSKLDPVSPQIQKGSSLLAVTSEDNSNNSQIIRDASAEGTERQSAVLYVCTTAAERNRWMLYLKRLVRPTRDLERRRENCLHVWIQEAKGLTGQHRYHCEILLDGKAFARTTSKLSGDMLFWGEEFDLSGVSEFTTLSIKLFRDSDHTGSRDSSASRHHRTMSNPHLPGQRPHQSLVLSPPPMRRDVVGRTGMLGPDEFVFEVSPPSPSLYISHGKANRNKGASGTVGRKAVGKHGKNKRSKHATDSRLIATVVIPPEALATTSELESWYPVTRVEGDSTPTTGSRHKRSHATESGKLRGGKEHHLSNGLCPTVQLRIKTRHRCVTVLPLTDYARLQHHLARFQPPLRPRTSVTEQPSSYLSPEVSPQTSTDSALLLASLDPWLGVKAKAELAGSVVALHQALGQATDFLAVLILHEVFKQPDANMVLRGNSIATKAMEIYLRLVGENYLCSVLSEFVRTVLASSSQQSSYSPTEQSAKSAKPSRQATQFFLSDSFLDCEVDPAKLQNSAGQLNRNRSNLLRLVELVWSKIVASEPHFPRKLRMMFASVRQQLDAAFPPSGVSAPDGSLPSATMSEHVISACLFLRYICPAILSPSLFGLISEFPSDQRVLRAFTLVAKAIQSLANFSVFSGAKEGYMSFLNPFVTEQLPSMRRFLEAISSPIPTISRELHPVHTFKRDIYQKAGADSSRVFSSQSHHTGFTNILNGKDDPMEQRPMGTESASSSSSILTRSISGLPTTGIHSLNNPPSITFDRMQSPSPLVGIGYQFPTEFPRQIRDPILLPTFPLKSAVTSTAVGSNGYDSTALSGEHIDLALCLALCHMQLSEAVCKVPTDKPLPQVIVLKPILEEIDYFLKTGTDPDPNWWRSVSTAPRKQENGTVQIRNHLTERNMSHVIRSSPPPPPTPEKNRVSTVRSRSSGCLKQNEPEVHTSVQYRSNGYEMRVSTTSDQSSEELAESMLQDERQHRPVTTELPEREFDKDMRVSVNVKCQQPIVSITPMTTTEPSVVGKIISPRSTPMRPEYGRIEETRTISRLVTKVPSEDSTLWSIDTDSQPKPTAAEAFSPKSEAPQIANFVHISRNRAVPPTCPAYTAANSSSSGYQSLGRHELYSYNPPPCDPTASTIVHLGECDSPLARSHTSGSLTCTVTNPLYAVHPSPGTSVASCYSGSTTSSPVKQADKDLAPLVQATPLRSNSFTGSSNQGRRHTYVNLNNSPTTEALLVAVRNKSNTRGLSEENSTSPGEFRPSTRAEVDRRLIDSVSDVGPPLITYPGREILPRKNSSGGIPNGMKQMQHEDSEGRQDSAFTGDDMRHASTLNAVLEGYNQAYHISGSDSVRSVGVLGSTRPSLFPVETSPIVPANIRDELDASQARLAEAQARLLANEAERIQLLRAWHNELMRQSQLVSQTSICSSDDSRWRRPSLISDPTLSPGTLSASETTQRLPVDGVSSDSGRNSSTTISAAPLGSSKTSQPTSRSQRVVHSAQPRMGASVIGTTTQDPIQPGQSTLPQRKTSTDHSTAMWLQTAQQSNEDDQWIDMNRSPSTPGLSCTASHTTASALAADYDDLPTSDSVDSDHLNGRSKQYVWDGSSSAYIRKPN